jgi:hypothetical protein
LTERKDRSGELIDAVHRVGYCSGCGLILAGLMVLYGLSLIAEKL